MDTHDEALITITEANELYFGDRSAMWLWRRQNEDPNFPSIYKFSATGRRYVKRADAIAYRDRHKVGEAA